MQGVHGASASAYAAAICSPRLQANPIVPVPALLCCPLLQGASLPTCVVSCPNVERQHLCQGVAHTLCRRAKVAAWVAALCADLQG